MLWYLLLMVVYSHIESVYIPKWNAMQELMRKDAQTRSI